MNPQFEKTLLALGEPVDHRLIQQRAGPGGRSLDYLEWHTVADILNAKAPGWEFRIQNLIPVSDRNEFVCHGALTIDGVTRENVGTGDGDADKGPKSAVSDCVKRCATLFGIGLQLYRDEQQQAWAVARVARAKKLLADESLPVAPPPPVTSDNEPVVDRGRNFDAWRDEERVKGNGTVERVKAVLEHKLGIEPGDDFSDAEARELIADAPIETVPLVSEGDVTMIEKLCRGLSMTRNQVITKLLPYGVSQVAELSEEQAEVLTGDLLALQKAPEAPIGQDAANALLIAIRRVALDRTGDWLTEIRAKYDVGGLHELTAEQARKVEATIEMRRTRKDADAMTRSG